MLKHFRSGKKRIRTLWWILTIGTVASFIGLFVFRSGTGVDDLTGQTRRGAVVGKVGGAEITDTELADAVTLALAQYKAQYNQEPVGRDLAVLKEQVWSNLVTQKALNVEAHKAGIGVSDAEIVYAVHNTPPQDVATNPAFQTNGRFDPNKWQQALSDPTINWFPLEQRMRDELPGQRLEERMIAGVKISEPELRRLYVDQYEKSQVTGALVPLDATAIDSTKLNDAALHAYYDAHKDDFSGAAQAQLEVASIARSVGEPERAAAKADADEIAREARSGTDFAELARSRSEGIYADKGGDFGQDLPLSRLPQPLATELSRMQIGQITDPYPDQNAYYVFKLLGRKDGGPEPSVRLAQIQKNIHPSPESLQRDAEKIQRLRKESAGGKLKDAATRLQLVSVNTGWFAQGEFVPSLIQMPQVQQWALTAKKGDVSRAFSNEVGWIVAQVVDTREAGTRPFDQVKDQVRQQLALSLRQAKPMQVAKQIVDAINTGKSLEDAAQAAGVQVFHTQPFARATPDGRIGVAPRAVGLAFGLAPGQVGGPVATSQGALLLRRDAQIGGTPAQFDSLKGSLSQTLLQARQRRFVTAWLTKATADAKVSDLRPAVEAVQEP